MRYRNFFEAARKKLYWESAKGVLSLYDLFDLSLNDLKEIYVELKKEIYEEEDPILSEISTSVDESKKLKYQIVKDLILWKKEERKRKELEEKKKQLEQKLAELKMKELENDPKKLEEELKKIEEQLQNTEED